jgi:hypothetical protein
VGFLGMRGCSGCQRRVDSLTSFLSPTMCLS